MKKILLPVFLLIIPFITMAQTFTNIVGGGIPDNNTLVCFPVTVSGLPTQIDTSFGLISCCIDITHTYDSDIRIYLKGPNNLLVDLSSTNGSGSDNYTGTCFKMDGLSGYIVNGSAPFIGTFVPEESLNLFNSGMDPNGDWFLCVKDEVPSDSGTVNNFSITFGSNPPADPAPPTNPCSVTDASGCLCPIPGIVDCDLLPDMTASALEIQNGFFEYPGHIDLSNATPNIGYGPLEIRGINQCYCDTVSVPCTISMCPDSTGPTELITQRIYHKDSVGTMTYYDLPAGTMTYHPSHGHIHVNNWASYTLRVETPDPDPRNWPIIGVGSKVSYCLINLGDCNSGVGICADTNGIVYTAANLPNYGLGIVSGCGTEQGIFVGSYDVYSAGLDGQRIDISGICNDNYHIVSITDPDNNFKETNDNNNWVAVPVSLSQQPGQTPVTAFTYSTAGLSVGFYNYATGNNTYYWDFGDGTIDSSGQIVSHNYTLSGNYTVILTIDNGVCRATSVQVITVQSNVNINEQQTNITPLQVSPNPSNKDVTISFGLKYKTNVELALYNIVGEKIKQLSGDIQLAGKHQYQLPVNEITPGVYFLKLSTSQKTEMVKLIIF